MAKNTFVGSESELDVIEVLNFGLSFDLFKPFEGLLETLKSVDVRAAGKNTLLHLGVKMGKLDWVEGLLGEGADPGLRGSDHKTVVEVAEELEQRYPEDSDRKDILRLIRLVHKRENAIKRRRAFYRGDVAETSLTNFPQEMAELSVLKESINSLTTEMSSYGRQMAVEVNQLRRDLSERVDLMECLECAVTSSAEDLRALNEYLEETSDGGIGVLWLNLQSLSPEDVRRECVDGMMGMTIIRNSDEGKELHVRGLYEKLYDVSEMTSCLLLFLNSETGFSVMVDCDSHYIGNMKAKVTNHNGVEESGSHCFSFADFSEMRVYFGGKGGDNWFLGYFTRALAQMTFLLAFRNEGKAYERGDVIHERVFKKAEVENRGERLIFYGYNTMKTPLGKEIDLVSAVPANIALDVSTESSLRERVPSLFKFYEDHVMRTLVNKARVSLVSNWKSIPNISHNSSFSHFYTYLRALKKTPDVRIGVLDSNLPIMDIRRVCVEGMMGRTIIRNSDEGKELHVRGLYEKLYDVSEMTSFLLLFLSFQTGFSVMVDVDSCDIRKMKKKVTNHDGVKDRGSALESFAEFSEKRVYLGGKVDGSWMEEGIPNSFTDALAQMSNLLAFRNEGKPYERDDIIHEREFRRALEEAEEEKRKKSIKGLDHSILRALCIETQLGKEIVLASVIPWIIVRHGWRKGTDILRDQVPSLLKFYEEHVMTTLLNKARAY